MAVVGNEQIYRNNTEIQINRSGGGGGTASDSLPDFINQPGPDAADADQFIAPNEIDNSDFDWSKDSYINNPVLGGDVSFEAFNWYRSLFIKLTDAQITAADNKLYSASDPFDTSFSYPLDFVLLGGSADGSALSGTLTRTADGEALLSIISDKEITDGVMFFGTALAESSALALKKTGHSLFAANENTFAYIPQWDGTNGWAEIGSQPGDPNFALSAPLGINLIRPGHLYYFRTIIARRTGTPANANALTVHLGLWDDTAGQDRFLEAGNLGLSLSAVGTAGSTAYTYKIIAVASGGLMIESAEVEILTGPAALSTSNYIRLEWSNVAGILDFRIERKIGSVFVEVFRISNGTTAYNDYGTGNNVVIGGFTSVGARRMIAYAEKVFTLDGEDEWKVVEKSLRIPPTYNSSNTTAKQWLRIWISGTLEDDRQVMLDRVKLSLGNGGWNYSLRDRNKIANQNPDANPNGSNQGGIGIGNCLTGSTPIILGVGTQRFKKKISELEKGEYLADGARSLTRLTKNRQETTEHYFQVYLSNGIRVDCTDSERFVTSRADKRGTMLKFLNVGDDCLTKFAEVTDQSELVKEWVERAVIIEIKLVKKNEPIFTPSLKSAKTFVAGVDLEDRQNVLCGAILHNLKDPEDF